MSNKLNAEKVILMSLRKQLIQNTNEYKEILIRLLAYNEDYVDIADGINTRLDDLLDYLNEVVDDNA